MRLWRLTRPNYAPGLDGLGARKEGGRWNSPGKAAVYCGGSLALCVLEVFVHLPPPMRSRDKLPRLIAVELEVPDDLLMSRVDWSQIADPEPEAQAYRNIGDEWLTEGRTLVLSVPSLVVPQERNAVLNPEHPEMAKVQILSQQPFIFDGRMATTPR